MTNKLSFDEIKIALESTNQIMRDLALYRIGEMMRQNEELIWAVRGYLEAGADIQVLRDALLEHKSAD